MWHRYVTGHIWACPPSEGDDYIFHCHPPDQKIPKPKRLQEWYKKMLDKAFAERIIHDYKVCYCLISDLIFIVFSFEGSYYCFLTPENWSNVVQGVFSQPVSSFSLFILRFCLSGWKFLRFGVCMKGNLQEPAFVYFSFTAFSRQGNMELVMVYRSCLFLVILEEQVECWTPLVWNKRAPYAKNDFHNWRISHIYPRK